MSQPYVGEIRMFGGSFAILGWAFARGQLISISEQETLFNLIGTTYGGDGQTTFALPNLSSRVPVHFGNGMTLGDTGGGEYAGVTGMQSTVLFGGGGSSAAVIDTTQTVPTVPPFLAINFIVSLLGVFPSQT